MDNTSQLAVESNVRSKKNEKNIGELFFKFDGMKSSVDTLVVEMKTSNEKQDDLFDCFSKQMESIISLTSVVSGIGQACDNNIKKEVERCREIQEEQKEMYKKKPLIKKIIDADSYGYLLIYTFMTMLLMGVSLFILNHFGLLNSAFSFFLRKVGG